MKSLPMQFLAFLGLCIKPRAWERVVQSRCLGILYLGKLTQYKANLKHRGQGVRRCDYRLSISGGAEVYLLAIRTPFEVLHLNLR